MSFAVRVDGLGFRTVGGVDELLPGEVFSQTQPQLIGMGDDLAQRRALMAVDAWRILRALTVLGWRDDVESLISGSSQDVKDMYTRAPVFRRLSPFVELVAAAMNKTDAEVDELFELAATIE
ncbi:hypothetical protein PL263_05260 [Methylomonas sp. EFPC3]|uniref:hypothetical protein n=1 Tax=Methylomonas sp. EFPC3 TaxID=3021710 RepID=UPI0024162C67|nr:hypothetical protein [Methylomonas sp. EFPC3]WFP51439.1 hypothetical protein PL263_05260 [Methylomonas sp. EFPC3]